MKCLYLIVLLSSSFAVANPQEAAQQPPQQQEVIRTNTELVQTAVTVLDKKGNFVDGLQREQFELTVGGKPPPVAFFERIAAGSTRERELATRGVGVNSNAPLPAATVPGRVATPERRNPNYRTMKSATWLLATRCHKVR